MMNAFKSTPGVSQKGWEAKEFLKVRSRNIHLVQRPFDFQTLDLGSLWMGLALKQTRGQIATLDRRGPSCSGATVRDIHKIQIEFLVKCIGQNPLSHLI